MIYSNERRTVVCPAVPQGLLDRVLFVHLPFAVFPRLLVPRNEAIHHEILDSEGIILYIADGNTVSLEEEKPNTVLVFALNKGRGYFYIL